MPCMTRFYKDKQTSVHWPAARHEVRPTFCEQMLVNRSSTARCIPLSICIGRRLFVLLKRRLGQLSLIRQRPWVKEGRLIAGQTDPSASRSAWFRPALPPPCAAPPRPARDISGFSRTCLARKGFTKTNRRRCPLVSSQERSVADVPRIKHSSTARQLFVV